METSSTLFHGHHRSDSPVSPNLLDHHNYHLHIILLRKIDVPYNLNINIPVKILKERNINVVKTSTKSISVNRQRLWMVEVELHDLCRSMVDNLLQSN